MIRKPKLAIAIALLIALAACAGAQAQTLFSDQFDPPGGGYWPDINSGYDGTGWKTGLPRQSGTLAPITWNERPETASMTGDFKNQTIIQHPYGDQELQFICTNQSWGGDPSRYVWASPNHNFTDNGQLVIEFDMDPNAYGSSTVPFNWGAVIIGTSVQGTYVAPMGGNYSTATSGGVGFSLSYDGIWSVYQDAGQIATGTLAGAHDGWYHVKVTIDTANFSGSSATVKFYVDGTLVHTLVKSNGFTSNYITLAGFSEVSAGYQNVFFDNFVVKLPPADSIAPTTTASPDEGAFFTAQVVTLSADEPATIYYTVDGTAPTVSSPVYTDPIEITQLTALKFFAVDTAGNYEALKTKVYNIGPVYFFDNFTPVHFQQYDINEGYNVPGFRQAGLLAPMTWGESIFTSSGNLYDVQTIIWHNMGDQELEFLCTGVYADPEANYVWASPDHNFTDHGKLDITFKMDPQASESARTDTLNWGGIIIGTDVQGTYINPLMGDYGTATSGGVGFSLSYDGSEGGETSGKSTWTVYEDSLMIATGVLDSATSPAAHDGWYNVKVQIDAEAFDGTPAAIRFLVDGAEVYSFVKQTGLTSNYITLAGFSNNPLGFQPVFIDDFKIMGMTVDPIMTTASPAQGVYATPQLVTLTTNKPGTVYYTTDGSVPTAASPVYTGPITISQSTNLQFFAVDLAGTYETPKKQARYTIAADPIVFLDTYDVSDGINYDINFEYDSATRQSGSAAPLQYVEPEIMTVPPSQLYMLTKLNAENGLDALSLVSTGNWGTDSQYPWVSPNKNFNGSGKVTIEFDLNPNANAANAPSGIWAGVVFGTDLPGAYVWPKDATAHFTNISPSGGIGFTISDIGEVYIFEDTWPNIGRGNIATHSGSYHIKVVIDSPGFGTGLDANVKCFVDDVLVVDRTRVGGFNNNYVTLGGNSVNGALVQHVFDNLLITAAASYTNVPSIKDAKDLADGTMVTLTDKVLYMNKSAYAYIEEQDRTNGIRLEGAISASEDTLVSVNGTIQTTAGGEKYIQVDSITSGAATQVGPLGSANKSLADASLDGVFVRAWGSVMAGSITADSFYITDGSDTVGIKVIMNGAPDVTEGSYVTLSGAAGTDSGARVIYRK